MIPLALASLLWVGVHLGIAGSRLRNRVVAALGEGGFGSLFSVLSVVSIGLLCAAYDGAPVRPLWLAPAWLLWLLAAVMLAASILFAGSVMVRNPTAIGGAGAEPRGIVRLTRHPMLWSFTLWAAVHIVGSGDEASLLFFGAFLVTAAAGMPSIDAKLAARDPAAWQRLAATTSITPGGRGWHWPGIAPIGAGSALWVVLFVAHPHVFGVSPVR